MRWRTELGLGGATISNGAEGGGVRADLSFDWGGKGGGGIGG
jgi:hypothetical protein